MSASPHSSTVPKKIKTYLPAMDAKEVSKFYKKVFNANEINRTFSEDGTSVTSCSLEIGTSILIFCSQYLNDKRKTGLNTFGGTLKHLSIKVDAIDSFFQKAVEYGCIIKTPLKSTVIEGRQGKLIDPFGVEWSITSKNFQLDDTEIAKITKKLFRQYLY